MYAPGDGTVKDVSVAVPADFDLRAPVLEPAFFVTHRPDYPALSPCISRDHAAPLRVVTMS